MEEQKLLYKKIGAYSMVACGSVLAVEQACAEDAYWKVGDGPLSVTVSDGSQGIGVDLNGDGVPDFRLEAYHSSSGSYVWARGLLSQGSNESSGCYAGWVHTKDYSYAGLINAGTEISHAMFMDNPTGILYSSYYHSYSDWKPTTRGFLGLALQCYGSSSYRFGFIDVEVADIEDGTRVTIGAGGGYNPNPGQPIVADFPPSPTAESVPVAAAAIPASLGLLALGAGAIRRRRKSLH